MRWGWIGAGVLVGVVLFLAGMFAGRLSVQQAPEASKAAPEQAAPPEVRLAELRTSAREAKAALREIQLRNAELKWWIGHVAPNAIGCAMPVAPDGGARALIPSGHVLGPAAAHGHYRIGHTEANPRAYAECVVMRDGQVIAAGVVTQVLAEHAVVRMDVQAEGVKIRKGDAVWFVQ